MSRIIDDLEMDAYEDADRWYRRLRWEIRRMVSGAVERAFSGVGAVCGVEDEDDEILKTDIPEGEYASRIERHPEGGGRR